MNVYCIHQCIGPNIYSDLLIQDGVTPPNLPHPSIQFLPRPQTNA